MRTLDYNAIKEDCLARCTNYKCNIVLSDLPKKVDCIVAKLSRSSAVAVMVVIGVKKVKKEAGAI